MVFFWLKRLIHRNKAIRECSFCQKQFFQGKTDSMDYYYWNEFTNSYEYFIFCSWNHYDLFYREYRETPFIKLQKKIRRLALEYIVDGLII